MLLLAVGVEVLVPLCAGVGSRPRLFDFPIALGLRLVCLRFRHAPVSGNLRGVSRRRFDSGKSARRSGERARVARFRPGELLGIIVRYVFSDL